MRITEHIRDNLLPYSVLGGILGWAALEGSKDSKAADTYGMTLQIWVCGRCHEVYDVDEKEQADMCCLEDGGRAELFNACLLYTSPSPRDVEESRMPSSA